MSNLFFWLSDDQMSRLKPHFSKSHVVPGANDKRVLNGILLITRNGSRLPRCTA